ncbi:MAG: DUF998 domain-containing protein [Gemmatimonadota bacterium]
MNTTEVPRVRSRTTVHPVLGGTRLPAVLLVCGILSALLYAAMVAFVAMRWQGYSSVSQTVSELSVIGAPTRPLWVALAAVYTLLVTAFGCGVWLAAGRNRRLRVVGGLQIAAGLIGPFWPPMHLRGADATLTDTLHVVFAVDLLAGGRGHGHLARPRVHRLGGAAQGRRGLPAGGGPPGGGTVRPAVEAVTGRGSTPPREPPRPTRAQALTVSCRATILLYTNIMGGIESGMRGPAAH